MFLISSVRGWLVPPLLALTLGCSCGSAPHGDADPPRDAGPRDAGHRDGATRDSGRRDTGAADAGTDAAINPEWVALSGLPDWCTIERAEAPESLLPVEWVACSGMERGCRQLVSDVRYERAFLRGVGASDTERGYFGVVESEWGGGKRMVVLASTEGALAAWRGPDPAAADGVVCQVGPAALAPPSAGVGVRMVRGAERSHFLYHAPLDEIARIDEPTARLDDAFLAGSSVQRMAASATTLAVEIQPSGVIALVEAGRITTLTSPRTAQRVHVVDRDVFWEDWPHPVQLYAGGIDSPATLLRSVAPADVVSFAAGGDVVAWLEASGWSDAEGTYARMELWAAPYARSAVDLRPRRVRGLDDYSSVTGVPVIGGGHFALVYPSAEPPHRVDVWDLADARRRRIVIPLSARLFDRPLYINENEIMIPVTLLRGPAYTNERTLWRIDLASLEYDP